MVPPPPGTTKLIKDATAKSPASSPAANITVLPLDSWRSRKPLIPSRGISTCSPAQTELVPRIESTRVTLKVTDVSDSETIVPSTRSTSPPNRPPTNCRPLSFRVTATLAPVRGAVS